MPTLLRWQTELLSENLAVRMPAIRDYAERRGWTLVASVEDIGSGAKERPKRAELIKLAKRRQIDVIARRS
jgi:DNA invertase Pin-like site-specific DNA recombinase